MSLIHDQIEDALETANAYTLADGLPLGVLTDKVNVMRLNRNQRIVCSSNVDARCRDMELRSKIGKHKGRRWLKEMVAAGEQVGMRI